MLPFPIHLVPGRAIYEQIVHAVKKALATGHLQSGDRFPSIRSLSAELKINPNTAQKAVAILIRENILESRPGQSGFIAAGSRVTDRKKNLRLLEPLAEKLLAEASRQGLSDEDVLVLIHNQSRKMKRP